MQSDDTLKKLALPLALVAAFIASSGSMRTFEGAPTLRAPVLDAQTAERWGDAYRAATPLIQLGN